jgi:hypothetical protein
MLFPSHPGPTSCVILIPMRRLTPNFLVAYSFAVTLAFILTVYIGFIRPVHGASRVTDFDRIRAHRIDLVEPDGTERLILSNRTDYPGSFFHNQEVARPDRRDSAGLLMMNDEGTEDGGFIWGGLTADGKPMSFTHLSFDQYEQDQTLNLESSLSDGRRFTGIHMSDVPDYPITPQMIDAFTRIKAMPDSPARAAAFATLLKQYPQGHQRLALDRDPTNNVGLTLRDPSGNPRLKILVAPDGTPALPFLDPAGHITRTITPTEPPK